MRHNTRASLDLAGGTAALFGIHKCADEGVCACATDAGAEALDPLRARAAMLSTERASVERKEVGGLLGMVGAQNDNALA